LTLEEIQNIQGNETVNLYLHTGRVKADVSPPDQGQTHFDLISPMVTASVRGTSFEFDGINLTVDRGLVHVSGETGTGVYVGAGQRTVYNRETGKPQRTENQRRADLTPDISDTGVETIPQSSAAIPTSSVDVRLGWN
jgi:hypothetical protein